MTATFGSAVGSANAVLPDSPLATDVYSATINAGTVPHTNPASLPAGFFDAVEPTFQSGGAAPTPDATGIILFVPVTGPAVTPPLNVVRGFEEGSYMFSGLVPSGKYFVEVSLFDMDEGVPPLAVGSPFGPPALETVDVTGNGALLDTVSALVGGGGDSVDYDDAGDAGDGQWCG